MNLSLAMAWLGVRFVGSPAWAVRGGAGGFDRVLHARKLRVPLLVLHGEQDEVCPVQDGRDIAAAAELGRLEVIPDGTHNGMWSDPKTRARCDAVVSSFVRGIASGATSSPADR